MWREVYFLESTVAFEAQLHDLLDNIMQAISHQTAHIAGFRRIEKRLKVRMHQIARLYSMKRQIAAWFAQTMRTRSAVWPGSQGIHLLRIEKILKQERTLAIGLLSLDGWTPKEISG